MLERFLPQISLAETAIDHSALKEVPAKVAAHYPLMPVGWENGVLRIVMPSSVTLEALDEVRVILGRDVVVGTAPEREIEKAIQTHYGIGADTLERLVDDAETSPAPGGPAALNDLDAVQEASVMKFVNQMLLEAHRSGATDIHLEPYPDDLRVRTRIDGLLYEARVSDSLKRFQPAIISRIKIMADLSIAEKRLPQDGRIIVRVEGREMDLRVSTLPTPFGESVGIRLLTSRQLLDLPYLGFAADDLKRLESYLLKPHGIILLTGPTGSGKTTTLYAFLKQINQTDKKIITLEDPIEYQMKGITQVQVQPKIGLTFANGLRAMLRHDPDVMMIGEVRDLETAEIAIRVSLTGHLVFSTLHTNDASGAITRLEDIGVEPYLISSSVLCIIAQRLVRVICKDCRRARTLSPELRAEFGLSTHGAEVAVYAGQGCETCKGTGFRGRTVIYEILPVTPDIQDLIVQRAPSNVIREKALAGGMRSLRQCGWGKVLAGVTTPDEVIRVTMQEGL
jgi:type II secretory ATPase GspE/PulE/Tfp pilus assembly ATPase PilB-like protein